MARLEHVNLTVADPDAMAAMLCTLFGWEVRWSGTAIHGGRTVHVGSRTDYLALYTGPGNAPRAGAETSYNTLAGLNHIGIVVDDLGPVEEAVKALGFTPHSHADYEPGKRFYFHDADGVEFEIVCYN